MNHFIAGWLLGVVAGVMIALAWIAPKPHPATLAGRGGDATVIGAGSTAVGGAGGDSYAFHPESVPK